jgi:hypothetical protein
MNERMIELMNEANKDAGFTFTMDQAKSVHELMEKFAELIIEDMHKKVIASILITDVVMEEKGLTPTSEDYIQAINKDFGVK